MDPTETENFQRIARLSRRLRALFLGLAVLQPVALIAYWLFYNALPPAAMAHLHTSYASQAPLPFPLETRLLALFATAPAIGGGAWIALILARLFGHYSAGRIFEAENVRCFRRLGYALLALAGLRTLSTALGSLALTWANPPGQKALALTIQSQDLVLAIAAVVTLLIARVMEEGRRLEDERRLTILKRALREDSLRRGPCLS